MITFEEAYEIANKTYMKDEIGSCEEWENGYVFSRKDVGDDFIGGKATPLVVHKKDGQIMSMMQFVCSGAGKPVRNIKI